jgi:hypothetical protein
MPIRAFRFQLRPAPGTAHTLRFFEGHGRYPRLRGRGQDAGLRFPKASDCKLERKAIDRLGRVHARIAAQRGDWLHKLTTKWADAHPVIAIEDLKVAQAWGEARRQLEYKTAARRKPASSAKRADMKKTRT